MCFLYIIYFYLETELGASGCTAGPLCKYANDQQANLSWGVLNIMRCLHHHI